MLILQVLQKQRKQHCTICVFVCLLLVLSDSLNKFTLCYTATVIIGQDVCLFVSFYLHENCLQSLFCKFLHYYSRWLHLRNQFGVKQGTLETLHVTQCLVFTKVPISPFKDFHFHLHGCKSRVPATSFCRNLIERGVYWWCHMEVFIVGFFGD